MSSSIRSGLLRTTWYASGNAVAPSAGLQADDRPNVAIQSVAIFANHRACLAYDTGSTIAKETGTGLYLQRTTSDCGRSVD